MVKWSPDLVADWHRSSKCSDDIIIINKLTQTDFWKAEASSDGAVWEDYLNTQFQAANYGVYAKCSVMKVGKLNLKRAS